MHDSTLRPLHDRYQAVEPDAHKPLSHAQARVCEDARSFSTAERAAAAGACDDGGPAGRSASAATGGVGAPRNIPAPLLTSTSSTCQTVCLPVDRRQVHTSSGPRSANPVTRDAGLGRYQMSTTPNCGRWAGGKANKGQTGSRRAPRRHHPWHTSEEAINRSQGQERRRNISNTHSRESQ